MTFYLTGERRGGRGQNTHTPIVAAGVAAKAATRAGVTARATKEAGVTARATPIIPLFAGIPAPVGPLSRVTAGPSSP